VLLGVDLRGRIRRIGELEKNPQRLQVLCKNFRLGEAAYACVKLNVL